MGHTASAPNTCHPCTYYKVTCVQFPFCLTGYIIHTPKNANA